jgi:hypothetical protein
MGGCKKSHLIGCTKMCKKKKEKEKPKTLTKTPNHPTHLKESLK